MLRLIGSIHKHSERLLSRSGPGWDSRGLILRDRAGQRGNNRLHECHHETITHLQPIMQMEGDLSSITVGGLGSEGKPAREEVRLLNGNLSKKRNDSRTGK